MSTENNNTENVTLDSATQAFYDFIKPEENQEGGSSSEETSGVDNTQGAADPENKNAETVNQEQTDSKTDDQPQFDLNKYFEGSSEGLIKSEDEFKVAIGKIKEYDALQEKVKVLEAEKETIFADDYIKKLNNLRKAGYSNEQIDAFQNLSKLDIDKLDPKEALIQNEVLNKGRTRVLAERLVSDKYGLDSLSLDDDTLTEEEIQERKGKLELATARMEDDAKPILDGFKTELEGLTNIESPEQKALDEAAKRKSYEKALEPFVESLQKSFPEKIVLPTGEEGVEFSYDLPKEFLDSIKTEAKDYFNHPSMEVNKENVDFFVKLKKALFVYENLEDYSKKLWSQAETLGDQKATKRYENPHGLDKPNADVDVTQTDISSQLYNIAKN